MKAPSSSGINKEYKPQPESVRDNYLTLTTLFELPLSPTKVYLAVETETDTSVIKKAILKDRLHDESLLEAARVECTVQSQLVHPNVVKMLAFTETDEAFHIYLEYCSEATLVVDRVQESRMELTADELKQLSGDILRALAFVHSKGVIHADIKPDNVLGHKAQESLAFKLCDFGLSRVTDS